jgi:hypothetical protein
MKMLALIISFFMLACNTDNVSANMSHQDSAQKVEVPVDETIIFKTDSLCKENLNGSNIHYYFPNSASLKDTIAILLIFDPSAKGERQIAEWKSIAKERSIMLLSVDDSKNGKKSSEAFDVLVNIKVELTKSLKKPFQFYATGLSGGSRTAVSLQINSQLFKGVILCCAAPSSFNLNCPAILYTANVDMNFLECYEHYQNTNAKNLQLRIEKGEHAWPKTLAMSEMIQQILGNHIERKIVNSSKMSLNPSIMKYEAEQQALIQQSYFQKPIEFWNELLSTKRASSEAVEMRVLNYTSLYSYSMVNNPQVMNDPSAFDYALKIYEGSDSKNNEWMYLRSVYYLQQKDENNAFKYIEKAIKNGFSNTERLFQNTYWKNYVNDTRFTKLISQIPS